MTAPSAKVRRPRGLAFASGLLSALSLLGIWGWLALDGTEHAAASDPSTTVPQAAAPGTSSLPAGAAAEAPDAAPQDQVVTRPRARTRTRTS